MQKASWSLLTESVASPGWFRPPPGDVAEQLDHGAVDLTLLELQVEVVFPELA